MKKVVYSLSILLATCFCISGNAFAQITVVPSATAVTLMNKLLGPGVVAINPVLNCAPLANGTFLGPSSLSFDSGIVLTSGRAQTVGTLSGCNGPASGPLASLSNGTPGDAQLTVLAGNPTHDACILEFDFKPAGDTIKFDYVFGSEEYTDYTCNTFNDVFGFFITGTGYATPTNIARVPGTNIPVCINSVNCGPTGFGSSLALCTALGAGSPFCAYYINNSTGTTVRYDGITTTLTAIAAVTPCDTYHLRIGIADAFDESYDSGVFLKAGSLTSTAISIAPVGLNPDEAESSQYCVRGCLPGKFVFNRSGDTSHPFTIHYIITGDAVNGYDYTTITDSVVIPAGDTTTTLSIYGLPVPPAGTKIVKLLILAPYTCGGAAVIIDSAQLAILDSFNLHINTADTAICLGQHVLISTTGDPVLTYTWTPATTLDNATIEDPTATPSVTTTYIVTGQYVSAGCSPSHDAITITVYVPPVLNMGPPTQITCQGTTLQLGVNASPTGIPYTYSWTPALYLNDPAISNPTFTPGDTVDREQSVTVTTPVPGCATTGSIRLHVVPNDFELNSMDTGICFPPQTYPVRIVGDTELTYHWSPETGVSNPDIKDPSIAPVATTIYTLTASYPHCPDVSHTILYSIEHPQVDIMTGDTIICIGLPMPIRVSVTPSDSPYTFTWSQPAALVDGGITVEPSFYTTTPGIYNYTLTVHSGLGCTDSDKVQITAAPPVVIGIRPGNTIIPYGTSIQLTAFPISPDPLLYTWIPNNGTLNNPNVNNPMATPLDSTTYTVYGMNQWGCIDSAKVTIDVDQHTDDGAPTAFTPNGDGLNDVFRIFNLKNRRLVDFKIYNRWGQLVYENTSDPAKGWDGYFNNVKQDAGTYNYVIILATPDGENKVIKGNLVLIR